MPINVATNTVHNSRVRTIGHFSIRSSVSPAASRKFGGDVLEIEERIGPLLRTVRQQQGDPARHRDAFMGQVFFAQQFRKPFVHHRRRLFRRQGGGLERRGRLMTSRRALEDRLDQATLMQAVVNAMSPQIVFHTDIGSIPRIHRARAGTKGSQECRGRRIQVGLH